MSCSTHGMFLYFHFCCLTSVEKLGYQKNYKYPDIFFRLWHKHWYLKIFKGSYIFLKLVYQFSIWKATYIRYSYHFYNSVEIWFEKSERVSSTLVRFQVAWNNSSYIPERILFSVNKYQLTNVSHLKTV